MNPGLASVANAVRFEHQQSDQREGGLSFRFADTDQRYTSFVSQLLELDPSNRLSVAAAVQHPYLTTGLTDDPARVIMNPQHLHTTEPIRLPKTRVGGASSAEDQQWARRQFSVLWAPMPGE